MWTLIKMSLGFSSPGEGETERQKSPGGQVNNNNNNTHIQNPTVTPSSLSHIQILYIICHIHINNHGWSAALPHRGIL